QPVTHENSPPLAAAALLPGSAPQAGPNDRLDLLAVDPALGLAHDVAHDPPQVPGTRGPDGLDRFVDQRRNFGLIHPGRDVGLQDVLLLALLGHPVLTSGSLVGLDGLAAPLDL